MRRILSCVLFAIMTSAPLLSAQNASTTLSDLSEMNARGQFLELIPAANSFLANDKLTPSDQAMTLIYLGIAYQQRGEFTKATAAFEKALEVLDRDGHHPAQYAAALLPLATVYLEIGQPGTAKHLLIRSTRLFDKQTDHAGAAMAWSDLASIAIQQNSHREAHNDMKRSLAESQLAAGFTPTELGCLATTQGRIAQLDGDPRSAITDYERALNLWNQDRKYPQQRTAWLDVLLSDAYLQAGDVTQARETISRGLAILKAGSGPQTPRYFAAELEYAKVLDASGAHDQASTLRRETQTALTTGTDRQRTQDTISIAALR